MLIAPTVPLVGHTDLPYESDAARWDELAGMLANDGTNGQFHGRE